MGCNAPNRIMWGLSLNLSYSIFGKKAKPLKTQGLPDGRYEIVDEDGLLRAPSDTRRFWTSQELSSKGVLLAVGAARNRVFEIRPYEDAPQTKVLTDADLDERLKNCRKRLEREVGEDVEYERENGEVPRDSMPVI